MKMQWSPPLQKKGERCSEGFEEAQSDNFGNFYEEKIWAISVAPIAFKAAESDTDEYCLMR